MPFNKILFLQTFDQLHLIEKAVLSETINDLSNFEYRQKIFVSSVSLFVIPANAGMEQDTRIELASLAWEASILPLY